MAIRAAGGQQQLQIEQQGLVHPQADLPIVSREELPTNLEQEEVSFLSIARKLMCIVLKHKDKRDPLSNKLFMQGSALALSVINERSLDLPPSTLVTHFLGLKAIFNEECRCQNVTDPWLVGIQAWEKRELDLYCKALSHHSPRIIRSVDLGAPHLFGKEVIHWIEYVERQAAFHTPFQPHHALALQATTIEINELGVPVVVGLEVREENLIAMLASADPDEPIDIHTANKVLVEYKERMDGVIIERKKLQFTEDLKKQNALLASKLDEKNSQFDQDLTRLAESGKEQVAYLSDSLNRTVTHFDSALAERKKIEASLTQGLEKCEKELAITKAEVANQKIEIGNLKASNSWLNQRLGDLQHQVNNMDDGGCVIS